MFKGYHCLDTFLLQLWKKSYKTNMMYIFIEMSFIVIMQWYIYFNVLIIAAYIMHILYKNIRNI